MNEAPQWQLSILRQGARGKEMIFGAQVLPETILMEIWSNPVSSHKFAVNLCDRNR